ncbi:YkoP family protein [Paenibacillus mellifer]
MQGGTIIKQVIQGVWMGWERVFELFSRLRSNYAGEFGICKMFVTKYRGKSMQCEDGTWIQDGDWIGELHLDNRQILAMLQSNEANRVALMTARLARSAMRQICAEMQRNPQLSQVKALQGITLLHRGITHGLGFETHRVEQGAFRTLTTSYLRLLLTVFHPSSRKRIDGHTDKLIPLKLVMTRSALIRQFGAEKALV